ncbi:MAG TPA: YCF48-related protein, partial [Thermoleophilia bacterium]|nr:YCF48-related protein [Thermoleophilia bacterium]
MDRTQPSRQTPIAGPRRDARAAAGARGPATATRAAGRALLTVAVACFAFGLLVTSAFAATYNTWTAKTSGASTSTTLYSIAFADANNGWLVGSGGVIRHTTDGGTTWTAQTSGTTQNLRDLAFVDASNGWVVGNGGVILHTTNGGTTWTAQTSGTTQTLRDVVFMDANNGWAVGAAGTIRHTTNGGTTWSAQTSGTTQALYSLTFRDANNGWTVGAGGTIRRTSNGGTTWSAQTSGVTGTLYGVAFTDTSNGWTVGQTGTIRHTANGGTAWSGQTSSTTQTLYRATFLDANNGWTVGAGGTILHTVNGGTAWSSQTSGITSVLRSVVSANGSLWACGASGRLLTYLVDITAPVTTATGLQTDNHSGWRTTSQTVNLAATDAQSGVSATYYTVDGGARQTYGAPFVVAGEGSHTVTYWSVDVGGTTEATHTGYVNIDATAPVTTATGLQTDDHSGWRTTSQSVSLSAGDGSGSGVSTTTFTIDGGTTQVYTGAPFVVAGNGSHAVTFHSTDAAGNVEATHTGYVNIDTVAPVTVAAGLQTDNHSGWRNTSQVVTLTAADGAGSGVSTTRYTVDGGAAQTYTGAFTVSAPGSHAVAYFSQDAVGNVESTHTGYVNIDTTLPTVADDADSAWHRVAVTVRLTPSDGGGSGVAGTQYRAQGGAWLDATGNAFTVPAPADGSGDGARVYQYRALDGAGNVSATHSCTVWIDTQAPTTTAAGLADDDLSGWTTTSRTVELTPDDGTGSGASVTTYAVDGGPSRTYSGAFVVSGAGQHPVTYSSTDAAGNVEATRTGWVNISNPDAQADGLAADDHSAWHNADHTVTITAAGDHQPLSILYRVGAGSWQTSGNPAMFSVSGEGTHRVDFYARNGVGVESVPETGYVNIDLTAPVTTASGLQTDVHSGWAASSQSVGFAAADGLSGLAATYYRVDGGAWLVSTGAPVVVAGDGSHSVSYYSTDKAGNAETARTGYVNIDAAAPATTATGLRADDHSGWRSTLQTVSLSADDAGLSGVTATRYTVDGGGAQTYSTPFAVSGEGSHAVTYWSVDAVGNIESAHTGYVNIDATPPVSTPGGLQNDAHSGWRQTSQDVTLAATDALSGVAATHYAVDAGSQQTYGGAFTVAGDGSHPVVYWSVDAAGNTETHRTGYVNIDAAAPTTAATGLQANDHSGWRTADQTVTLSAGDGGLSGVTGTYYTLDGGPQQTYAGAFVVSGDGRHAVVYWSVDAAGNTEAAHTGYVNIDATAPASTATGLQANATSGWQNSAQTVTLGGDDAGLSGVAATYYRIDGGARQTYAAPFAVASAGSHAIVYWSVDVAGNSETAQVGYVNLDLSAPTVTSDADAAWHNSDVTVHLTPADTGGSGVAGTQYRLQGAADWQSAAG